MLSGRRERVRPQPAEAFTGSPLVGTDEFRFPPPAGDGRSGAHLRGQHLPPRLAESHQLGEPLRVAAGCRRLLGVELAGVRGS
jgi:hypothetical protein